MTRKTITLTVQPDDVEHILREAARSAALNGALCDYITSKTDNAPTWGSLTVAQCKKEWSERFLRAKRIVEAFGVEYEPTSEQETLTVSYEWTKGRRETTGLGFVRIVDSKPDYNKPLPCYRREVHSEACKSAADRVVRKWRAGL